MKEKGGEKKTKGTEMCREKIGKKMRDKKKT